MKRAYIKSVVAAAAFLAFSQVGTLASTNGITGQEAIANAGTLIIMLDNSGSSPATDKKFISAAWPRVEQEIRSMEIGSMVILVSVGDASLKPLNLNVRIQARDTAEGKTMDRVVAGIKEVVLTFPDATKGQEHGNTQMIGGFFDASRVINRKSKKNRIITLSDLIEYSQLANCYKVCKLPAPTFDLPGTSITVLGVGHGLHSDKEMVLFAEWDKFFAKTGASANLKKTF